MSEAANYVQATAPNPGDTVVFDGLNGPAPNKEAFADQAMQGGAALVLLVGMDVRASYGGMVRVDTDLDDGTLTGASMNGIEVRPGKTLTARGGALTGTAVGGLGTFVVGVPGVAGSMSVANTNLLVSNFNIHQDSGLTITGDVGLNVDTLVNDGTLSWAAGRINVGGGSPEVFNYGTFAVLAAGQSFGGGATIHNMGYLFANLGVGGACTISSTLHNFGVHVTPLEVTSGSLSLAGAGSDSNGPRANARDSASEGTARACVTRDIADLLPEVPAGQQLVGLDAFALPTARSRSRPGQRSC